MSMLKVSHVLAKVVPKAFVDHQSQYFIWIVCLGRCFAAKVGESGEKVSIVQMLA